MLRSLQEISAGECCVRDAGNDIDMLDTAGNDDTEGIWSDGTTIWVADYADAKIYAYSLTHYGRNSAIDINTLDAAGNNHPVGIWSGGTTMWVVDYVDKKLYAYDVTDRTDAPAILSVTAGTGSPTVSWRVPSIGSGTVVILSYDLHYIRSDAPDKAEANWRVLRDLRTTGSGIMSYEVTGLTGGIQYDIQLPAVTNRGPGIVVARPNPNTAGAGSRRNRLQRRWTNRPREFFPLC